MVAMRVGDRVRCLDNGNNCLTVGKVYTVLQADPTNNGGYVIDDRGRERFVYSFRFEKVTVTNTVRVGEMPGARDRTTKVQSDGSSTDYYKIPEGATDLIDLIEHKKMSFGIGNIFKACYRLGEKSGTDAAYDLRKIIFFAERALKETAK